MDKTTMGGIYKYGSARVINSIDRDGRGKDVFNLQFGIKTKYIDELKKPLENTTVIPPSIISNLDSYVIGRKVINGIRVVSLAMDRDVTPKEEKHILNHKQTRKITEEERWI